jgi:multiple sugar transport system ATP-binding protein
LAKVTLKDLVKTFDGKNNVVDHVNLEIADGEFLVLVGPSGCGKTTTLRMVAGLEEVSSGSIAIGDRLVNDVHPKDRDIAMVFQNYALYPHMSVKENLEFGLKLRKVEKKVIEERIAEASEILQLSKLLARKPRELSGGQRQRVALGRAIVRHPAVFLMDEPLSNLDAKLRVHTRGEIKKIHNNLKTTVIYVTHDQTEAMTLGDRIAIMNEGKMQQCENAITVYDQPANRFVAGFVGSPAMNFMDGRISKKGDVYSFEAGDFKLPLPANLNSEFEKVLNKPTTLGVRPSDLYDKTAADWLKQEMPSLNAKVDFSELLGSENFIHVKVGNTTMAVRVDSHILGNIGQTFPVFFNLNKMHLFDTVTSQRIL